MNETPDPRTAFDRAIEKHRTHYADLRQVALTLVYLRTKLEAEHPESEELAELAAEADRAKEALALAGREIHALERERLRAIAALSTIQVAALSDAASGLEDARDQIERIASEIELDRELAR